MRHALLASERSTCSRLNVGAVIFNLQTRSIIGTGYNGPEAGAPHCDRHCTTGESCVRALHAEANAINRSVFHDQCDYDLYVTHSPCANCAQLIYRNRHYVQRIFYGIEFRSVEPLGELARVMDVYKVTPAGYITRFATHSPVDPESLYDPR